VLSQEIRLFDGREWSERANFYATVGLRTDAPQFCDVTYVEQVLRVKEPLAHRGKQVGAPSDDADIARVLTELADRVSQTWWPQKFEVRQTHF